MEHEDSQTNHIRNEIEDRETLVARLAETFEPIDVVRLMRDIGLRYSDLALALDVHPRTVRAWLESSERDPERHRDAILSLKSVVLFLLRRGTLGPREVALWLVEPNEQIGFRRPLAVLGEEQGIHDVVSASATFTRPEPRLTGKPASSRAVAAGATGRRQNDRAPSPIHAGERGGASGAR